MIKAESIRVVDTGRLANTGSVYPALVNTFKDRPHNVTALSFLTFVFS